MYFKLLAAGFIVSVSLIGEIACNSYFKGRLMRCYGNTVTNRSFYYSVKRE